MPNRSEVGIVFCNIAVVLEFGDGWLLDSLVIVEGGFKLDIGVVILKLGGLRVIGIVIMQLFILWLSHFLFRRNFFCRLQR